MTTDRRRHRPHAAARARVVVAIVSASLSAALLGGMAAADRPPVTPSAGTPAPDPTAGVLRFPIVTRATAPPVTRSHAS